MKEVYRSKEEILDKISSLASRISSMPDKENISVICLLGGGIYFFSDLVKKLEFPLITDFLAFNPCDNNKIEITLDLTHDVLGRDLIIIEDVLDDLRSAKNLIEEIEKRNPKSLKIFALFAQKETTIEENRIEAFWQFEGGWLKGYGMGDRGFDRNLEDIYLAT